MRLQSIIGFLGFCDGDRWGSTNTSGSRQTTPGANRASTQSVTVGESAGAHDGAGDGELKAQNHVVPCWEGQAATIDLDACMAKASSLVKPWDAGSFTFVERLQDAVRNHGHVDKMLADGKCSVAVKRMPTSWVTTGPHEFKRQYPTAPERPWCDIGIVSELNQLGFPYVCELHGVFRDNVNTYVVASLATCGDLFAWCDRDPPPGRAREAEMLPIVTQILKAVKWLHELGIAHRDLSLENILLTDANGGGLQVKIIDFGMGVATRVCRKEVRGKQSYQAPEMHTDETYDAFLTDVFALGVTIFAMAAQDYPWTSTKRNACQLNEYVSMFGFRKFLEKRKLRKGHGESLIEVFSPDLVELIEGMLQRRPVKRYSLGESCYAEEVTGTKRGNVWETEWMGVTDVCCE
mmetsp:Transcript_54429/g.150980  ORF Transcript_54429/g.150980 Transcript_54429/m.150980 type:complete len:406 (-) Transcript_54429:127-1344(-)